MKRNYLLFLALFLATTLAQGQVTIGSGTAPAKGALLDLKEETKDDGSENAKKGLGLPRVELKALDKLTMGNNVIADDSSQGGTAWTDHTGLLVYHVSGEDNPQCADIVDGLYVWDGEEWIALKKPEAEQGTLTLKNGTVTLTDGQKIHIASGADGRGTTIPTLMLTAEWTGEGLVLTPTGKTGGSLSPFVPMISSPTWTSGTDVTVTNKPENIALSFADMSSLIAATPTAPWKSREWELKFKVVDACGRTTIEKTVTLNQTNYVLGVKEGSQAEKFENFTLASSPLKSTTAQNLAVRANTTWKATVTSGTDLITVTAGTDTGGTISDQGIPTTKDFTFTPQAVTGKKYETATVKFEDTGMDAAKPITVTMQSCLGTEDLSGLTPETAANSGRIDWETAWGDKVILHGAKTDVYEEFTSADFGAAGRWMTTNLTAWKTDGTNLSPTYSFVNSDTEMHMGYPNGASDPTTPPSTWNSRQGMLYNWPAAMGKVLATGERPTEGVQGICPQGWHLPTDAEWTQLEGYYTTNKASHSTLVNDNNPYTNGTAMKDLCENGANASKFITASGFNLLLAGYASYGSVSHYGNEAYLWSSSFSGSNLAWNRNVNSGGADVYRGNEFRNELFSVRCKKD